MTDFIFTGVSHWCCPSCFHVHTGSTPSLALYGTPYHPKKLILRCETLRLSYCGRFASAFPFSWPPPTWSRSAARVLLVVLQLVFEATLEHPDFSLCPGVIFSVDKHDCSVLCSTLFSSITDTLSHMCYWLIVVVQLESELSVLWLKDTCKSRYVKLLHKYCIYFWFCGCLWSPKTPLSVCRSCSLLYAHTCVSHRRHQIAAAHQMLLTLNQQARHLRIEFTGYWPSMVQVRMSPPSVQYYSARATVWRLHRALQWRVIRL